MGGCQGEVFWKVKGGGCSYLRSVQLFVFVSLLNAFSQLQQNGKDLVFFEPEPGRCLRSVESSHGVDELHKVQIFCDGVPKYTRSLVVVRSVEIDDTENHALVFQFELLPVLL